MIYFQCDYTEGADPSIIEKLSATNMEQCVGYGLDVHSIRAKELIKKALRRDDVDIHFIAGGTETNRLAISYALRPYQGVLAADTGHIAEHETGAIEASGHEVLTLPNTDGKISAEQVRNYVKMHYASESFEHTVQPKMVYISYPTESGTLYSKKELEELYGACKELGLYLYIDGARLGYALSSPISDIAFEEIPDLSDMFYIGGTKCGALLGEALVIVNKDLKKDFRYMIKQNGSMLAKGRVLGIQFEALFESGRYFEITKRAVDMALRIRAAFEKKGIRMFGTSMTNQQFAILEKKDAKKLSTDFKYEKWGETERGEIIARFCTSWATTEENLNKLLKAIEEL